MNIKIQLFIKENKNNIFFNKTIGSNMKNDSLCE